MARTRRERMSSPLSRTGRRRSSPPPADPPVTGKKQPPPPLCCGAGGRKKWRKDLGFSREFRLIYRPKQERWMLTVDLEIDGSGWLVATMG
jgi:hypothetical protein